jgi:hypothetical protein
MELHEYFTLVGIDSSNKSIQYLHKVWKHGECFRASNTAAYGPKCLPFLRDNSRLS